MTIDLEVGVYGLRTFRIEELTGTVVPLHLPFDWRARRDYLHTWSGGTCIAKCWFDPSHHAPEDGCSCGIYCFRDVSTLRQQYDQAEGLVAVIALEGNVIEGERGWRAQAARVVALWAAPGVVSPLIRRRIKRQIPHVRWLSTLTEVNTFPGVRYHAEPDHDIDLYRLRRSIVFASTMAWGEFSEFRLSLRLLRGLLW